MKKMKSNNQELNFKDVKIQLTKDTKIYLLNVLKNGYIDTGEFSKAFHYSLAVITDPNAWIRFVHDINICSRCGQTYIESE